MRTLVFLLILINIVFFLWIQEKLSWLPWQPGQFLIFPTSAEQLNTENIPTLRLLSESTTAEVDNHYEEADLIKSQHYESELLDIPETEIESQEEMVDDVEQLEVFDGAGSLKMLLVENTVITDAYEENADLPETSEETLVDSNEPIETGDTSEKTKPSLADKVAETLSNLMKPNSAIDVRQIPESASSSSIAVEKSQLYCVEIGPYEKLDTTHSVMAQLKKEDILVERQRKKNQVVKDTQVYLPPFPNRQAANQAVTQLISVGVKDYAIMNRGELKNGISLGVYRGQNSVKRRLKSLKAKGYHNITTKQRFREVMRYWIKVKTLVTQQPTLENLVQSIKPPQLNVIECQ